MDNNAIKYKKSNMPRVRDMVARHFRNADNAADIFTGSFSRYHLPDAP